MKNQTEQNTSLEWIKDASGRTARHFIKHTFGWNELLNQIIKSDTETDVYRLIDRVHVGGNSTMKRDAVKEDLCGRVDAGWCECQCPDNGDILHYYRLAENGLQAEYMGDILYLISYRKNGERRILAVMADMSRNDTMPQYL